MEDTPRPFLEHLEELRFRLIKSLVAIAAGTAIAYQGVDRILAILARPVGKFVFLEPTEAFFVRLKIALFVGVVLSFPMVLYQIWKFVVIAVSPLQRRSLSWILPSSYGLFIAGFSFGAFVLGPAGIRFLLGYQSEILQPNISVQKYVDFLGSISLVLGAVFQAPLVAFYLGQLGILQPEWLASGRRYAVLGIYVFSALITPGPDPVTAILLAVPTYLLYECSILAARAAKNATH